MQVSYTTNNYPHGTQEAVCANTAYKRHVTAKCHKLDSPVIWQWFLVFLYIRFHNLFSFWGSGLGKELGPIFNFGLLGCLGALYGQFIWPTSRTLNNAEQCLTCPRTCEMRHVTCDTWLVACGMLQVTCYMSHVTYDRLKCDTGWMQSEQHACIHGISKDM